MRGEKKKSNNDDRWVSNPTLVTYRTTNSGDEFVVLVLSLLSCCLANANAKKKKKEKKSNQVSASLAVKREPLSGVSLMTGY